MPVLCRTGVICVLATVAVTVTLAPVAAQDWPSHHRDATNNGASTAHSGPGENASVAWTWQPNGSVVASPAVSDDTVYVGVFAGSYVETTIGLRNRDGDPVSSGPGAIVALNASTGQIRWRHATDASVFATPAVADDRLYVASIAGTVTALNATTGSPVWRFDARHPVLASPTTDDGRVYVGTRDLDAHELAHRSYPFYALDASDGSVAWRTSIREGVFAAPAVAHDRVYVGGQNGTVTAHDPADGDQVWRYRTPNATGHRDPPVRVGTVTGAPTVVDDAVYTATYAGDVLALAAANGTLRWRSRTSHRVASSPTVRDGVVTVGDYAGRLHALEASTGEALWNRTVPGRISKSSPAMDAEAIYVGTARDLADGQQGALHAVAPVDGDLLWSHDADGYVLSSPAITTDRLYYAGSHVVAVRPAADGGPELTPSVDGGASAADGRELDRRASDDAPDPTEDRSPDRPADESPNGDASPSGTDRGADGPSFPLSLAPSLVIVAVVGTAIAVVGRRG